MSAYTHKNLMDVEDSAPGFGVQGMEARFARQALGCERIGLALQRLEPNTPGPFAHKHQESEEVYVVTAGSGTIWLDGEEIALKPWDAVRVAPATPRAFSSGPDGLEFLAFGTHPDSDQDGELLPSPWAEGSGA